MPKLLSLIFLLTTTQLSHAAAASFTVNSLKAYQFYPGYSGLLALHYQPNYLGTTGTTPWPGDWYKFSVNLKTTSTTNFKVFIDYNGDGALTANEELYLIESEPSMAGSTPFYQSPSRGKTLPSTGNSNTTFTYYTPFFSESSSRNSTTSDWFEAPVSTIQTTFYFVIESSDGTYTFSFENDDLSVGIY